MLARIVVATKGWAGMLGLAFAVCATTAQAQKTAPPITRDSDRDGVPDLRDRCRATPFGTPVDGTGCPAVAGSAPTEAGPRVSPGPTLMATPLPTMQPVAFSADHFLQGTLEGRQAAERTGTSGRFVGGLAGGLFLGLIGTAIVYVLADNDAATVPATDLVMLGARHPSYLQGYDDGFRDRLRSRRKSAALGGGLLGTALLLVVVAAASQ